MVKVNIDHIGILVKDIEKAMKFYENLFGWKIPDEEPYRGKIGFVDEPGFKYKYALLKAANNVYLELLEPVEGPWVKDLREKGEGAFHYICAEVEDIDKMTGQLADMGIKPTFSADFQTSLTEKKYIVTPSRNKIAFLPRERTMGTRWELIERPIKVR